MQKNNTDSIPNGAAILVVDDEPDVLDVLSKMLERDKHVVFKANNAIGGLALIQRMEFDVIISDFRMPGVNGKEFYEKAMEIKPGIKERFIFTTGALDPARKQKFIAKTGARVLSKPFLIDEVRAVLGSIL